MSTPSEPTGILVQAALEVLRPLVLDLRRRGWDTGLSVDEDEGRGVYVSLRIHVPELPLPIEAAAAEEESQREGAETSLPYADEIDRALAVAMTTCLDCGGQGEIWGVECLGCAGHGMVAARTGRAG